MYPAIFLRAAIRTSGSVGLETPRGDLREETNLVHADEYPLLQTLHHESGVLHKRSDLALPIDVPIDSDSMDICPLSVRVPGLVFRTTHDYFAYIAAEFLKMKYGESSQNQLCRVEKGTKEGCLEFSLIRKLRI